MDEKYEIIQLRHELGACKEQIIELFRRINEIERIIQEEKK